MAGIIASGLAVAATGLIGLPWLGPEVDGKRTLQNGYDLVMLKGYPRLIMLGAGSGPTTVPSTWQAQTHEVGRYAAEGAIYFGEVRPWHATPGAMSYFILDTSSHQLEEFDSRVSWDARLRVIGVDPTQAQWRY